MTIDRTQQYRKIHAMLRELKLEHVKQFFLDGYGVESTKDLTDDNLVDFVSRLVVEKKKKETVTPAVKEWRSNVLTLLTKYGVYKDNSSWAAVNRFLLEKRISGKLLYEHDLVELKILHRKLQSILAKREDVKTIEKHLATNN